MRPQNLWQVINIVFLLTLITLSVKQPVRAYSICCKWALTEGTYKFDSSLPTTFQSATIYGASVWTNVPASSWIWNYHSYSANLIKYGTYDGPGGALAATVRWKSGSTIVQMEIKYDSAESWYTGSGTPSSSQYDLRSAAAHEFGHALGLDHTQPMPHCPGNTLNATMCSSFGKGTTHMRTLQSDDETGLDANYP